MVRVSARGGSLSARDDAGVSEGRGCRLMVRPVGLSSSLSSSLCGDLLVMRGCGDARCTTSEGSVVKVDVTVGCSVIIGRPFLTDGGSVFAGRRFLVGASGETDGVPSEGRETHELLAVVSPPPRCRPLRLSWPLLCFRRCLGRCSDGSCGSRPVVAAALPSLVPPSRFCFRRDVCGCRCTRRASSVWCAGMEACCCGPAGCRPGVSRPARRC